MVRLGWVLVIVAVGAIVGCSEDSVSFDALTEQERSLVIPEASGWGGDDRCDDGAACLGPRELGEAARLEWVVVAELESVALGADEYGPNLSIRTPACAGSSAESVEARIWPGDIDGIVRRLDDGYELWFGLGAGQVEVVLAIDDEGRFAGLGTSSVWSVTEPLAQAIAEASSAVAREFLAATFEPVGLCQ